MSKIISLGKNFLFLSLVMLAGAVTSSLAQSAEAMWKGPNGNCPGGFYLDYMPAWEALIEAEYGTSNGDDLVCIREIKERGDVVGYRIFDNIY